MISLAEVLNPALKCLFVALQDDTPTQIKSTISCVTRLSLLPISQIKQIIFIWFLSHIRDYIGKKLMTWKNQVQFTVMKRFQMVGATPLAWRKISLPLSRICHEHFPLIFYNVPSSEDPHFIIAYQRNIKPIMKETFTLWISLCKKGISSPFWKLAKEKNLPVFLKFFLKFSDRRGKQNTYLKVSI